MEATLVVNPGSSSRKYALFVGGSMQASLTYEKARDDFIRYISCGGMPTERAEVNQTVFKAALKEALMLLEERGIVSSKKHITRVGVRVVAPGSYFGKHHKIDRTYLSTLRAMESAAPLHIPEAIREIQSVRALLPHALCVGVSDSAFHSTIPSHARTYSIPEKDASRYDVYRFGYHGLSMSSVLRKVPQIFGKTPERTVLCHIGSGVSVAALKNGTSIDTSMGFTPASGLMMGTRAGDIDPGALIYLLQEKNLSGTKALAYIQEEGGFQGLLGASDLRTALEREEKGDAKAEEAVQMFFYGIQKHIGACTAALGGIDALVLTATAAERNKTVRLRIVEPLEGLGILLHKTKNNALKDREGVISSDKSPVAVAVVHTNEMGEIAHIAEKYKH